VKRMEEGRRILVVTWLLEPPFFIWDGGYLYIMISSGGTDRRAGCEDLVELVNSGSTVRLLH